MTLDFDRCCAEIGTQAGLLAGAVDGADLGTPVPSCPGWNVAQLLRHLGGGLRWAEEIVRTRATGPLPDAHFRQVSADPDPTLGGWVATGAEQLAATLRRGRTGRGPLVAGGRRVELLRPPLRVRDADAPGRRHAGPRRRLHRGPGGGRGRPGRVDGAGSLPEMLDFHPAQRELLGPGRTVHLHATDRPAPSGSST